MFEYLENTIMQARLKVGFLTPISEDDIEAYIKADTTVYVMAEMDPLTEFYYHGAYDPNITYAVPTKLRNVK
jgi:hypothetical protein